MGSSIGGICVKDNARLLESGSQNVAVSPSGKVAYYINETDYDNNISNLYRISLSGGTVGQPELYDSGVAYYTNIHRFINDNDYAYLKNYNKEAETADLYINKELVESDYGIYSPQRPYELSNYNEKFSYSPDYNDDTHSGTVKFYDKNKVTEIGKNIYDYFLLTDGRALYISNYDSENEQGELYEWSKGKTRKIDVGVKGIYSCVDTKYKSNYEEYFLQLKYHFNNHIE